MSKQRVLVKDKYVHAMEAVFHGTTPIAEHWECLSDEGYTLFRQVVSCSLAGCLTQIRETPARAIEYADEAEVDLVREIAADARIPSRREDIRPEHLNVFAEWQRRLDRELGEDR